MKLEYSLLVLNVIQMIGFWIIIKNHKIGKLTQSWRLAYIAFGFSCAVMSIRQIVNACSTQGFACLVSMADVVMGIKGEHTLSVLNFFLVLAVVENALLTLKVINSFQSIHKSGDAPNWKLYAGATALGAFAALVLTLGSLIILNLGTVFSIFRSFS